MFFKKELIAFHGDKQLYFNLNTIGHQIGTLCSLCIECVKLLRAVALIAWRVAWWQLQPEKRRRFIELICSTHALFFEAMQYANKISSDTIIFFFNSVFILFVIFQQINTLPHNVYVFHMNVEIRILVLVDFNQVSRASIIVKDSSITLCHLFYW